MTRKTKARPEPGKQNSNESISGPCSACGATIRPGDYTGTVMVPVGVTFDGELIGCPRMICAACLHEYKASSEGHQRVSDAVISRLDLALDGVTLQ